MAIQLEVPLRELQNPAVARALSELMMALGEHPIALPATESAAEADTSQTPPPAPRGKKKRRAKAAKTAPPPAAKSDSEATRAKAEPTVSVAEPAPDERSTASDAKDDGDKKTRARSKKNKKKWVPRETEPSENDQTLAERYQVFYDQLPDLSRAFLRLLEIRGTLTPDEALSELKINSPKALGGLTGSISRWAPKRGVPVPFRVEKPRSGPRIWRWTLDRAIAEEKSRKR